MSRTVLWEAMPEWLATELSSAAGPVAVLAGHFAIFSAGGTAIDMLDDPESAPAGAAAMADFTRRTWRLACRVGAARPDRPFLLVPLVDDIQFIRPVMSDRSASERLAAALAAEYLERTRRLPVYHARELAACSLRDEWVLRNSDSRWLFSERELRLAAVRRVRRQLVEGGASRAGLVASEDGGGTMTVTLPELGDYCLVQSGHTSCAGGYLELLATLFDRGVRKLIAMVPMRCLGQVGLGTTLAHHLFSMARFSVINVGVPDAGVSATATVIDGS